MKSQTLCAIMLAWLGFATPSTGQEILKAGFDRSEAQTLLDLCINLNGDGAGMDAGQLAVPGWTEIYDGKGDGRDGGFGPFDNRWKLWQDKARDKVYAIVVRGTIADVQSIKEDVFATSIRADPVRMTRVRDGGAAQELSFALARTPGAEVHLGFAAGVAVLMFDPGHGMLDQLRKLPDGSRVYVTGHSQGAALATLVHAFLYHALNADSTNRFGLAGKAYRLKSYVYAQPKPGNWQFTMDFAQHIGNRGLAFTINNFADWVPQVPLSIQLVSEALEPIAAESGHWFARFALHVAGGIRKRVSGHAADVVARRDHLASYIADPYWRDVTDGNGGSGRDLLSGGASLDYMPAGTLLGIGPAPDDTVTAGQGDLLAEHHLARYKSLLRQLQTGDDK